MQPFIYVQCPYCDSRGQLVVPQVGAVLVAPCPRCRELVLVFAGTALPLDKHVFLHGEPDEQRAHLAETVAGHLVERLRALVDHRLTEDPDGILTVGDTALSAAEEPNADPAADAEVETAGDDAAPPRIPSFKSDRPLTPISDEEVRDFLGIDLHLIARKVHFDRLIGGG